MCQRLYLYSCYPELRNNPADEPTRSMFSLWSTPIIWRRPIPMIVITGIRSWSQRHTIRIYPGTRRPPMKWRSKLLVQKSIEISGARAGTPPVSRHPDRSVRPVINSIGSSSHKQLLTSPPGRFPVIRRGCLNSCWSLGLQIFTAMCGSSSPPLRGGSEISVACEVRRSGKNTSGRKATRSAGCSAAVGQDFGKSCLRDVGTNAAVPAFYCRDDIGGQAK